MRASIRVAILSVLFVLGLIALDQTVRVVMPRIAASPYAEAKIYDYLAVAEDIDLLLLGSCRVTLNLDPAILGEMLGKRVVNAGTNLEGIGNMDFALALFARPANRGKEVLFVLDDGLFNLTAADTLGEIERRLYWFKFLSPPQLARLRATYPLGTPLALQRSGFWAERGQGWAALRTFNNWRRGQPAKRFVDNYLPNPPAHNLVRAMERELSSLEAAQSHAWVASPYINGELRRLVAVARENGLKPSFIVSPMHRLRGDDRVNAMQIENARNLARDLDVPLLTYLDNHTPFANDPTLWNDPGHLNRAGAEIFSRVLAKDLAGVKL